MERILQSLYGNIYSDQYEEMSDGGPKCFQDIDYNFRIMTIFVSGIICLIYISWSYQKGVKNSIEIYSYINKKPHLIEVIFGLISLFTFVSQSLYKLYTNRGIFMLNPCHIVVLIQIYLFLAPKSRVSSIIYIGYMRWLYGTYSALIFPSLEGLELMLEYEMFWFEHLMGTFLGPIILIAFGRYGYFEWKEFLPQQLFGWGTHILYMRFLLTPLSIITMANLNFTLCRPNSDPFIPIIGNWYLLLGEIYLGIVSVITFIFSHLVGKLLLMIFQNINKQK